MTQRSCWHSYLPGGYLMFGRWCSLTIWWGDVSLTNSLRVMKWFRQTLQYLKDLTVLAFLSAVFSVDEGVEVFVLNEGLKVTLSPTNHWTHFHQLRIEWKIGMTVGFKHELMFNRSRSPTFCRIDRTPLCMAYMLHGLTFISVCCNQTPSPCITISNRSMFMVLHYFDSVTSCRLLTKVVCYSVGVNISELLFLIYIVFALCILSLHRL